MRFLLTSAIKDLRRRLADPLALAMWIGLPLLLGVLISFAAGGGDEVPTAHVLLVNEDDSDLSELLVTALTQSGISDRVALEFDEVDRATGEARIGDGDGTALLILPPGFAEGLLEEQPTTLTLITNPAETILPEIVVEVLEIVREAAFYAQRVLGEPLRAMAEGPATGGDFFESAEVAVLAAQINDRMVAASRLLDPPMLEIEFDSAGTDAPVESADPVAGNAPASSADAATAFDLVRFLLPGMILMSILFIAQGMSDDVWTEKENGTLRRAVWAPRSLAIFVGGKLLAGLLLMAIVATMALATASLWLDVGLARVPLAVLWCAFAGTGLFGLFLLIAMLATSHRTANLITMMVMFPLMMIGGSFFPLETLPPWMAAAGAWTPNGIALIQLSDIALGDIEPGGLAVATALIAGFGAISLWLCVFRARRFVTQ